MKTLNESAKRARDLAAEKHKLEVAHLRNDLAQSISRQAEWARKYRVASTWKSLILGAFLSMTGIALHQHFRDPFDTGRPPAHDKIRVVIYGFVDAKGVYREYENGEPLNPQPIGWMKP